MSGKAAARAQAALCRRHQPRSRAGQHRSAGVSEPRPSSPRWA